MNDCWDKSQIQQLIGALEVQHPNAVCELDYSSAFELLVAVILSAQCTDKRVNQITAKLFEQYNTPQQFAEMPQEILEKYIFSCGFYHNKAKNIILASKDIVQKFGGIVPDNVDQLMTLAGVGKKTANVVYSEAFGGQAIAVDTHVFRVSNRLGLANEKDPLKVEKALMDILPHEKWSKCHHLLIHHGRYVCHSRSPKCDLCAINNLCKYKEKNLTNKGEKNE